MMEQPQQQKGPAAALLPDDVLAAEVLASLPPRSMAVARAVCRAWRAAVDRHGGLLRARQLLPLSLAGIFVGFKYHSFPEYFSRPSATRPAAVSGRMESYLMPTASTEIPGAEISVLAHCNGLLLLELDYWRPREHNNYVVNNPATRAWAPLPPAPGWSRTVPGFYDIYYYYLVFDPSVSPDYEVVAAPRIKDAHGDDAWPWPASAECTLHVFSSRTNRWEGRSFVREGEAILDAGPEQELNRPFSVYSRGALYVFYQAPFLMRISLLDSKYRLIKLPPGFSVNNDPPVYLGKSENDVYLASVTYPDDLLQIWMLDESRDPIEWSLKHNCDLRYVLRQNCYQRTSGPWVLHDVNFNFYRHYFPSVVKEAFTEEKYEWDSDDDDVLCNNDRTQKHHCGVLCILGFHPFKEVIFFSQDEKRGLAYHWNTSKVQDLGNMYPTKYEYFADMWPEIIISFPYTPCWM